MSTSRKRIIELTPQYYIDLLRQNDLTGFLGFYGFIQVSLPALPKKEEIDKLIISELEKTDFNENDLHHIIKITVVLDFFDIPTRSLPSSYSHLQPIYQAMTQKVAKDQDISVNELEELSKTSLYEKIERDINKNPESIFTFLSRKDILDLLKISATPDDPKFAIFKKSIMQLYLDALRQKNYVKFSELCGVLIEQLGWKMGKTPSEEIEAQLKKQIEDKLKKEIGLTDFKQDDLELLIKIRAVHTFYGLSEVFLDFFIPPAANKLGEKIPAAGWQTTYHRASEAGAGTGTSTVSGTEEEKKAEKERKIIEENTNRLQRRLDTLETQTLAQLKKGKITLASILDEQSILAIQAEALKKETDEAAKNNTLTPNNASQNKSRAILIGVAIGIGIALLITAAITIAILTGGIPVPGYIAAAAFLGAWISESAAVPIGATIITTIAAVVTSTIGAAIGAGIGWLAKKFIGNNKKPNTLQKKRNPDDPPSPPTPPRLNSTTDLTGAMKKLPGSAITTPTASPTPKRKKDGKDEANDHQEEKQDTPTKKGQINKNDPVTQSTHSTRSDYSSQSGYSAERSPSVSSSSSSSSDEEEENKQATTNSTKGRLTKDIPITESSYSSLPSGYSSRTISDSEEEEKNRGRNPLPAPVSGKVIEDDNGMQAGDTWVTPKPR